jgi:WD40 repeat protein
LTLAAAPFTSEEGKPVLGVWDAVTGQVRHRFEGPNTAAAFSPDARLLARGEEDGRITVWSLPGGEEIASLRSDRNRIHTLSFAQDRPRGGEVGPTGAGRGWLLAAGDAGGLLTVWDVGSKLLRAHCYGSAHEVTAVAFSPDGQTIASGGRGVRIWDLATGRPLLSLGSTDFIHGLAFSPDGRQLSVAGLGIFGGPWVDVWDMEPHRGVKALLGLRGKAEKLVYSSNGRFVAGISHDWQIAVWETGTGFLRHVFEAPRGITADNAGLAFSPDGSQFAVDILDRAVVWDLETGRVVNSWKLPKSLNNVIAFHPSGKLLSGRRESKVSEDRRVPPYVFRVRHLQGPDPNDRPLVEIDAIDNPTDMAVTPDGRYFAVDGARGPEGRRMVKVFDSLTGQSTFETMQTFRAAYSCIALDPTGRILRLFEGHGKGASLLGMPSGRLIRGDVRNVAAMGPDMSLWATLRYEKPNRPSYGFSVHGTDGRHLVDLGIDYETAPTFSTDGHTLAWGTPEGTVYLADLIEVQRRLAAVGLGW